MKDFETALCCERLRAGDDALGAVDDGATGRERLKVEFGAESAGIERHGEGVAIAERSMSD